MKCFSYRSELVEGSLECRKVNRYTLLLVKVNDGRRASTVHGLAQQQPQKSYKKTSGLHQINQYKQSIEWIGEDQCQQMKIYNISLIMNTKTRKM